MANFWVCDIHGEHGQGSFNHWLCSGCAQEYVDKLFWTDFHRWREIVEPGPSNRVPNPHVKIRNHGYLPNYHFEIVTKNLIINKPMVYGRLDTSV